MSSYDMFEETTEYIESNLDDDLNLTGIALEMNYSKYYFHRLFLSEMGVSVMDYLKRRRIIRSSYALVSSSMSITRIAFDLGYNNVDTYTRSFRRYYGVTPSKYRELNHVSVDNFEKEFVVMNNYGFELGVCTEDEKNRAIPTMERILELSRIAHKKGLLSLEEAIEPDDLEFLKIGISLLLRGVPINKLQKILVTYARYSNLSNFDLFVRTLIIEGIVLIHQGAYPWDIRIELSSYFGEDFIDRLGSFEVDKVKLDRVISMSVRNLKDNKLSKELKTLNYRSMQRLLRECDIVVLALALHGLEKSYKEQILEALPIGRKSDFLEVADLIDDVSLGKIVDAHEEIYKVVQKLRLSKDLL